jgi:hypothetical protein
MSIYRPFIPPTVLCRAGHNPQIRYIQTLDIVLPYRQATKYPHTLYTTLGHPVKLHVDCLDYSQYLDSWFSRCVGRYWSWVASTNLPLHQPTYWSPPWTLLSSFPSSVQQVLPTTTTKVYVDSHQCSYCSRCWDRSDRILSISLLHIEYCMVYACTCIILFDWVDHLLAFQPSFTWYIFTHWRWL